MFGGVDIFAGSPSQLFFEGSFHKDHCLERVGNP